MTPWTAVHQAPLWESPIKNTGECCHFLLQGIFPTQGSNPCLLCLLYWQNRSVLQGHRVSISDEPVISIQFCVTSQIIFFPFKSFVEEEEAYLSFFFSFFFNAVAIYNTVLANLHTINIFLCMFFYIRVCSLIHYFKKYL